jgi:hypothetical protein
MSKFGNPGRDSGYSLLKHCILFQGRGALWGTPYTQATRMATSISTQWRELFVQPHPWTMRLTSLCFWTCRPWVATLQHTDTLRSVTNLFRIKTIFSIFNVWHVHNKELEMPDVRNETPYFYYIECLQWNSMIFGDVWKNWQTLLCHVLMVSCLLQRFKPPPKFLGSLTGHRWGAPTVLTQKCIAFLN